MAPPRKLRPGSKPKPKADADAPRRTRPKPVDEKPSNVRGKQEPEAPKNDSWQKLAEALNWPADASPLEADDVVKILRSGNVKYVPGATKFKDLVPALESKSPEEWLAILRPNYKGAGAGVPPKADPLDSAGPAPEPEADAEPPEVVAKRKELSKHLSPEASANIPADQLDQFLDIARGQAAKGLTRAAKPAKPDTKPAKPAAAAQAAATGKPKGGRGNVRSASGADKAAVTTDKEDVLMTVDNPQKPGDPLAGGLSSEQLYKLARQQQIREGMTPGGIVSLTLDGESVKLPAMGDVGLVDQGGVISTHPHTSAPTPTAPASPAVTSPATATPTPQQPVQAGPTKPSLLSEMKMPRNPFGYDTIPGQNPGDPPTYKNRIGRSVLVNAPRAAFWTGVAGLGGAAALKGIQYVRSEPQGAAATKEEMDAAILRAIEARQRLDARFGTADERPAMIGADAQGTPPDTIRMMQRGAK